MFCCYCRCCYLICNRLNSSSFHARHETTKIRKECLHLLVECNEAQHNTVYNAEQDAFNQINKTWFAIGIVFILLPNQQPNTITNLIFHLLQTRAYNFENSKWRWDGGKEREREEGGGGNLNLIIINSDTYHRISCSSVCCKSKRMCRLDWES